MKVLEATNETYRIVNKILNDLVVISTRWIINVNAI